MCFFFLGGGVLIAWAEPWGDFWEEEGGPSDLFSFFSVGG